MSDNAKAAAILRQYAGGLYQCHTIGGQWDDGCHIKAEHDEMLALADRLEIADAAGAVADAGLMWSLVRSRVQGIHTRLRECGTSAELDAALDAYSHVLAEELAEKFAPRTDSGRVAELEALVGKLRVALAECVYALEVCGKDYRATEIGREALIPQETK